MPCWGELLSLFCQLLAGVVIFSNLLAHASSDQLVTDFPLVTNVSQLRQMVGGNLGIRCAYSLSGTVLAVNSRARTIFFQDGSGTEILEASLASWSLQPGQSICLTGTNYVIATAMGISLGAAPVVDNDGWHIESECTATVELAVGRHPVKVLWFNYGSKGVLNVDYSCPGQSRRPLPSAWLSHLEKKTDGSMQSVAGLNYRCYEGEWRQLPDFSTLPPVKSGVAPGFDMHVASRTERVGLTFDGFIEITNAGPYTFYLRSDDGSQLFLGDTPVQLTVLTGGDVPAPRPIAIRQPLAGDQAAFWAETEGQVSFLGRQKDGTELELSAADARLRLLLLDPADPPQYLLGGQLRARGVCLDTANNDPGSFKLANRMVISDWQQVQVVALAPEVWQQGKSQTIKDCRQLLVTKAAGWVRLRGTLRASASGPALELTDATGTISVDFLPPFPPPGADEIECLGTWTPADSGGLRAAVWRQAPGNQDDKTNSLPTLTTCAQVQQLNREEARRNYHAKIRGVVVWVAENRDCVVIQDATRGVFVGLRSAWQWETPKVGEILEVDGTCVAGEFSPIVILNKGSRLGLGQLPAPMPATWDQLIGGSLDSQYVEIRGLVTGVRQNHLTLLMPGGSVEVEFDPSPAAALESFVNSVVRIRGCMFAKWDSTTFQITLDHPLWFGSATICMDTPPPQDPFKVGQMRARELMQYDVQRNFFRRVKVTGQILYGRTRNYGLTDAGFGVRFQLAQPAAYAPGDRVEVAGLVQLGEASPVFREAVARKTGHAPLPEPVELILDPTNKIADLTRVCVAGVLADVRDNKVERLLEIQVGLKSFVARLPLAAVENRSWSVGSRLQLTGIYSRLGGDRPDGAKAFELLLDSPADVVLIARPPWWTLNRLLTMIALLAAVPALAFIWITLLRRQVERRTTQLQLEISERKRVEQDRAIEQERSRIARDLHDDLGSSLTAINMLALTGRAAPLSPEASHERLHLIADKARGMVTTLDELVWAVNPKNDTVAALAEYLASFAEEFLARTDIVYRVELPLDFPAKTIASETRHNLLLAVKEALTNAVRHGQCSEILLRLTIVGGELKICIRDNGRGFDPAQNSAGNGLANLQERLLKVNGRCEVQSMVGQGTVVSLTLPL